MPGLEDYSSSQLKREVRKRELKAQLGRKRGDFIPTVNDYAHWNEDAQAMWYAENKYDMEHWDEPVEDDEDVVRELEDLEEEEREEDEGY